MQEPAHGSVAAAIAVSAEFLAEKGGVGASFLPATREGVEVGVEFPAAPGDPGDQVIGGCGFDVAADDLGVEVQCLAGRHES